MTDSLLGGQDNGFDDTKDYFTELVGDGKKFNDEKALAKGKAFADHHISLLEAEKAEMVEEHRKLREELNARAALEELIDQMKKEPTEPKLPQMDNVDKKPSF